MTLLTHFRRKMGQLCLWTKIRTKQWHVLGASAVQCMRAGFLCPKCDTFACLRTRQDQNELHLKRWLFFFFFLALFKRYTTIYRIKLIICQIIHELSFTIHEISNSWKKTLNGGPFSTSYLKFDFRRIFSEHSTT